MRLNIEGRVAAGQGRAATFTQLDWVRANTRQSLGIDPYPGTLNLRISGSSNLQAWQSWRRRSGIRIPAQRAADCDARCYPVRIADQCTAAVLLPEISDYPEDQVEVISAVGLRDTLSLRDGNSLQLSAVMPGAIKAVIFDVDGTLVNSVDAYHIAAGRAAKPYGISVSQAQIKQALNSGQEFWAMMLPEKQRKDVSLIQALREGTMQHWPDVMDEYVRAFDGLADSLQVLREAKLRLAIYTGSTGESFSALQHSALLEQFEVVVTANDVAQRKPHPEGIVRCLEILGLEPGEAAYLGDSVIDIQAAHRAGVFSVGVLTGSADATALSLAGAHRLAANNQAWADILLATNTGTR